MHNNIWIRYYRVNSYNGFEYWLNSVPFSSVLLVHENFVHAMTIYLNSMFYVPFDIERLQKVLYTYLKNLIARRTVYRHHDPYQSHSSIFSLVMYLCFVYACRILFVYCFPSQCVSLLSCFCRNLNVLPCALPRKIYTIFLQLCEIFQF